MTETPTQPDIDTEADDEQADDWTMPQAPATEPDTSSTGTDASNPGSTDAGTGLDENADVIKRYLTWGALGVCSLLAVFALIQFYGAVADAIDLWVDPKYQPLMRAAFNLAVLLGSLIGVSLLVRELS